MAVAPRYTRLTSFRYSTTITTADNSAFRRPTYQPTDSRVPPAIVIALSNASATIATPSHALIGVEKRVARHCNHRAARMITWMRGA